MALLSALVPPIGLAVALCVFLSGTLLLFFAGPTIAVATVLFFPVTFKVLQTYSDKIGDHDAVEAYAKCQKTFWLVSVVTAFTLIGRHLSFGGGL